MAPSISLRGTAGVALLLLVVLDEDGGGGRGPSSSSSRCAAMRIDALRLAPTASSSLGICEGM